MMLTGPRPSIFFKRSMMGRKHFSYGSVLRMSSMDSTTTASTPGSPIHWGVTSLGAAKPTE